MLFMTQYQDSYVSAQSGLQTRMYWVETSDKIDYSVICNLPKDQLKDKRQY